MRPRGRKNVVVVVVFIVPAAIVVVVVEVLVLAVVLLLVIVVLIDVPVIAHRARNAPHPGCVRHPPRIVILLSSWSL